MTSDSKKDEKLKKIASLVQQYQEEMNKLLQMQQDLYRKLVDLDQAKSLEEAQEKINSIME